MANETEIVEVRLPLLPKGYRYTGEYRYAQQGDLIMPRNDVFPWVMTAESDCLHHIIEKIEWVPSYGETFFTVSRIGVTHEILFHENHKDHIKDVIESGNYFRTQRLARNASDAMKAMFKELPHE
jgi:hypothetical protein